MTDRILNARKSFPILDQEINGKKLIYLDNAATTQMPECVIDCINDHYHDNNANIHRGIHTLSERSTAEYENARKITAEFINAPSENEIVFTHGTTESINMAAFGLMQKLNKSGTVIVSSLEHHSNFLPWQRLCKWTGADFVVLSCPDGEPDLVEFEKLLSEATKSEFALVAITHVSNLTGTVFNLKKMIKMAHDAGCVVLVDGAQAIRHEIVDVQDLDCDFYCFSAHKVCGPSGVGVLYGKSENLESLEPFMLGGGMVDLVTYDNAMYSNLPNRLEAGTPNISGVIALGRALKFIEETGRNEISAYEKELIQYAENGLSSIKDVRILGNPENRAGVVSFNIGKIHPYDAASLLDKFGVALRSGTHCAQPAFQQLKEEYSLRLSPAFYNTLEEIDIALNAVEQVKGMINF